MRNVIIGSFVGFILAAAFLSACGGASSEADIDGLTQQVASLQTDLATTREALAETQAGLHQAKEDVAHCTDILAPFSRLDNDVYIDGANLHVRNGLDDTQTTNSLGNVIIGYNELRSGRNDRSGSHMLVVGLSNNYSSYGGTVVGRHNETSGIFASVTGGLYNTASAEGASVSGGHSNSASNSYASVSGGYAGSASGIDASISGGQECTASGRCASISGGHSNDASGDYSTCSGRTNQVATTYGAHAP